MLQAVRGDWGPSRSQRESVIHGEWEEERGAEEIKMIQFANYGDSQKGGHPVQERIQEEKFGALSYEPGIRSSVGI